MGKNQDGLKGKLSATILSTLLSGDKYGFEIISEIEKSSAGSITIKQPSLYSALKRMEEQDLIYSYWMDSDIGGRRHYYRITDYGKKHLDQLKTDLSSNFVYDSKPQKSPQTQESKPIFLQQESLFEIEQKEKEKESTELKPFEDDAVLLGRDTFIQYNLFEQPDGLTQPRFEQTSNQLEQQLPFKAQNESPAQSQVVEEKQTEESNSPYDIFAELDLFRNSNKSFAGSVSNAKRQPNSTPKTLKSFTGESYAVQKLNNLESNDKESEEEKANSQAFIAPAIKGLIIDDKPPITDNSKSEEITEKADSSALANDAKFIVERYDEQKMPAVKKIQPTDIDVFAKTKNPEMKAQNRVNSYDEKIGELYSKVNRNAYADEITPLTISNYSSLKKYFEEQKIPFCIYSKSDENITTQTSLVSDFKFALVRAGLTLTSLIVSLLICFGIICRFSFVPKAASALYIVPLALYIAYEGIRLFNKSKNKDRKILLMEANKVQFIIKACVCLFLAILVCVFNVVGGLNSSNLTNFSNTLFVPLVFIIHIPLTSFYAFVTSKFNYVK